jgi:acetyltransferase-like isoleucine patch superfamily enzyme
MSSDRVPASLPPNPYNEHAWIVGDPDIGDGTWIGPFTHLDGSGGLRIGTGCDISTGAQIYTHSTVRRCVSGRLYNRVDRAATILGDNVFVGAAAVILMGVTIGDGVIVGAGAVVTGDVAPYTVVAGVPARPIAKVVVDGDDVRFESLAGEPGSATWT